MQMFRNRLNDGFHKLGGVLVGSVGENKLVGCPGNDLVAGKETEQFFVEIIQGVFGKKRCGTNRYYCILQ